MDLEFHTSSAVRRRPLNSSVVRRRRPSNNAVRPIRPRRRCRSVVHLCNNVVHLCSRYNNAEVCCNQVLTWDLQWLMDRRLA